MAGVFYEVDCYCFYGNDRLYINKMKTLAKVIKEANRYRKLLIISALSTMMLSVLNLIAPLLMSDMTALVAAGLKDDGLRQIIRLAGGLLVLYLAKIVFRYLSSYLAHKAAWNLVKELRMKVYSKLQSLSIDFYRNHQSGDLVSRTINDTAAFELLYAHLLPESATNILMVTGVIIIMFSINAKLALLTCLPIPLMLLAGWFFAKKVRPNFVETQKSLGVLSSQLLDNFSGIQEIQVFNQQNPASEKVEEKASIFTRFMLKALKLSAVFHPSVEFLTAIGSVIVVGFGGYLAYQGQIEVGNIVAFLLYLTLFYTPITGLAQLLEQLQQALAGAERVVEILEEPETVIDAEDSIVMKEVRGKIEFASVYFSYTEDIPVLKDVSFVVEPSTMVALVGATGVGKSTIAQLIARFYDPQQGTIRIDDVDVKQIEINCLRGNIAMVLQDTFLFNGTIKENIAFARPEATDIEIEEAAKTARIHQDIITMPDGYNTVVGERGAKLSGGQKQRISIARAILRQVPILILDEATASVDVQTEAYIQQAINELAELKTIVIIAHRISTIRKASCILVLKDGAIIQRGVHEELLSKRGLYQTLCQTQAENT